MKLHPLPLFLFLIIIFTSYELSSSKSLFRKASSRLFRPFSLIRRRSSHAVRNLIPAERAESRQGMLGPLALPAFLLALPSLLPGLLIAASVAPAIGVVKDAVNLFGETEITNMLNKVMSTIRKQPLNSPVQSDPAAVPGALVEPPKASASNIMPVTEKPPRSNPLLGSLISLGSDAVTGNGTDGKKGLFSGFNVMMNQINAQQGSNGLFNVVTTTVTRAAKNLLGDLRKFVEETGMFPGGGRGRRRSDSNGTRRRNSRKFSLFRRRLRLAERRKSVMNTFRRMMETIKDGLVKYELSEATCRQRLICDINKNLLTPSFKSYASPLMESFSLEGHLKSSDLDLSPKAVTELEKLFSAVKSGLRDNDCALTYSRCPVAVAVEPNGNSLLNNLIRRRNWTNRRSLF